MLGSCGERARPSNPQPVSLSLEACTLSAQAQGLKTPMISILFLEGVPVKAVYKGFASTRASYGTFIIRTGL